MPAETMRRSRIVISRAAPTGSTFLVCEGRHDRIRGGPRRRARPPPRHPPDVVATYPRRQVPRRDRLPRRPAMKRALLAAALCALSGASCATGRPRRARRPLAANPASRAFAVCQTPSLPHVPRRAAGGDRSAPGAPLPGAARRPELLGRRVAHPPAGPSSAAGWASCAATPADLDRARPGQAIAAWLESLAPEGLHGRPRLSPVSAVSVQDPGAGGDSCSRRCVAAGLRVLANGALRHRWRPPCATASARGSAGHLAEHW